MVSNMNIVETEGVKKYYPVRGTIFSRQKRFIKALDGISLNIEKGEIYSLVGETGSGKTTLGKILVGLIPPTEGAVKIDGIDIYSLRKKEIKQLRKKVQMIFQDPYESLDPKYKVKDIIEEPLKFNHIEYSKDRIIELLDFVSLKPPEDFINKYPFQLSGGQRQRVAIARALAISPEFIIADEPVSMLDASIRANFLNILKDMNRNYNLSILMITHDISIASYMGKRISVLYRGKIVEQGSTYEIIKNPLHPYTIALIESIPLIGKRDKEVHIKDEISSNIPVDKGCNFYPRCPFAMDICKEKEPELEVISQNHLVACFLYKQ